MTRSPRRRAKFSSTSGTLLMEFAIVAPVFFFLLLLVFEIAYDMFLQEVLETALDNAGRQLQIGTAQSQTGANSGTLTTPASFVTQYLCPQAFGFLACDNLFVRVQILNTAFTSACTDVFQATTGSPPVTGNTLNLASFSSTGGLGAGTPLTPTVCDTNSAQGFCSPGKDEFVLLSAIYVAPSFLNGLLPNTRLYTYKGQNVRAQLAATAFQTENFTPAAGAQPVGYVGC